MSENEGTFLDFEEKAKGIPGVKRVEVSTVTACGFFVHLENGYRVSVQLGPGTYSDNGSSEKWEAGIGSIISAFAMEPSMRTPVTDRERYLSSSTAEVAVFDDDGSWVELDPAGDDNVLGWQTPDQVMDLIREYTEK
jgi:hypothetical protein